MEIKDGYKLTEVGVIPEDWKVKQLKDLSSMKSGNSITAKNINEIDKYPCFGGNGLRGYTASYTHNGEFALIGRQGALCGNIQYVTGAFFASEHAVVVTPNAGTDIKWLSYMLIDMGLNRYSESSAQPGLSVAKILDLQVAAPTEKTEQQAIATALSDIDGLINSLQKLIDKKKSIRQGAMQELLKPKDEWVQRALGETAVLKARIGWQGLTTAEYRETGDFFLITGTDFKNGLIDWSNCCYVDMHRYNQDRNIQVKVDDVLVTKDGTIGKVAIINDLPKPATLNSGVFVIRPLQQSFHPQFFYYVLLSEAFDEFLAQLSAGSTITHLYQKDFVNFKFLIPPTLEEQANIATVLSDMDSEIEALERKLDKYKDIKQGMMQELLTGRIRLLEEVVQ